MRQSLPKSVWPFGKKITFRNSRGWHLKHCVFYIEGKNAFKSWCSFIFWSWCWFYLTQGSKGRHVAELLVSLSADTAFQMAHHVLLRFSSSVSMQEGILWKDFGGNLHHTKLRKDNFTWNIGVCGAIKFQDWDAHFTAARLLRGLENSPQTPFILHNCHTVPFGRLLHLHILPEKQRNGLH